MLCRVPFGTFRRFYLQKVTDCKVGQVSLSAFEGPCRQFSEHLWRDEDVVVESPEKRVASLDLLQRD